MIKKLGFILLTASIFSCTTTENYVAYTDAENGRNLERAKKTSVQTFFKSRMVEGSDNPNAPKWVIVKEDSAYVYYGQLAEKNEALALDPFYKTNKEELKDMFPKYKEITGKHIKAKAFQHFVKPIVQKNLIPECPTAYSVIYDKKIYEITKNGIKVDFKFKGKCYENTIFKANTNGYLTVDHLDVSIENISIKN